MPKMSAQTPPYLRASASRRQPTWSAISGAAHSASDSSCSSPPNAPTSWTPIGRPAGPTMPGNVMHGT